MPSSTRPSASPAGSGASTGTSSAGSVIISRIFSCLLFLTLLTTIASSTIFENGPTPGSLTVIAHLGKQAKTAEERRAAVLGAFQQLRSLPQPKYLVFRSTPRGDTPQEILGGVLLEFVSAAVIALMMDRRLVVAPQAPEGLPSISHLLEGASEWHIDTLPNCDLEVVVESPAFVEKLQRGNLDSAYPQRVLCLSASRGLPFSDYMRHNPNYAGDVHAVFEHHIFQVVAKTILRPTPIIHALMSKILVAHKGIFVGVYFPDDSIRTPATVFPREKNTLLQCAKEVLKDEVAPSSASPKIFIGGTSAESFSFAAAHLEQGSFFPRGDVDDTSFNAIFAEVLALTHAESLVLQEASRFSQLVGALAGNAVYTVSLNRCNLVNCPLPLVSHVRSGCAGPSPLQTPRPKVGMLVMATGKYLSFVLRQVKSANLHLLPNADVTYYVFSDKSSLPDPGQDRDNIVLIHHEGLRWPEATLLRFHVYLQHWEEFSSSDYLFALDADMEWVSVVNEEDLFGDVVAALHPGFYLRDHGHISSTYENNPRSSAFVPDHERTSYFAGGFYGGRTQRVREILKGCYDLVEADRKWNYIAVWHDESYLNRYFKTNPPSRILTPEFVYPEPPVDQNFPTLHYPVQIMPKLYALNKNHAEMREG